MRTDRLRTVLGWIMDAFFPRRCPFCGDVIGRDERCCETCLPKLPRADRDKACRFCGKQRCVCSAAPILEMTRSAFYYEGCAESAVQRLKFEHSPGAAESLGQFMADAVREEGSSWDMVVPIPMTGRKVRRRGYNQAELLGRAVSASLDIPLKPALRKIRETAEQHKLNAGDRAKNLSGAYEADRSVQGKRVLLCDDVLTTGSTLREAAGTLLKAGAMQVGAVTLCSVEREQY